MSNYLEPDSIIAAMHDIIPPAPTGRRILFFIVFFAFITVCLGQESPASNKNVGAPVRAAATPPAVEPNPPVVSPPPAKSSETAPATGVQTAAPVSSQPKPKAGKRSRPVGPGEVAATGVQERPYEIGPDDVLFLNVLHQQDVSSQLVVRPDGYVAVRFAGEIKAAGLTTQQLADIISDKLTQYFNHPEVIIQVLRINSKKYYVSGEVRKPGAYTL